MSLSKFAAITSRKQLERELEKARKNYQEARAKHETSSYTLTRLQNEVNECKSLMDKSRSDIMNCSNHLQTMDLSGANAIRDRGDCQTYMVNDKEYHIDKNDINDIKMTPWKEYKDKNSEPEIIEEEIVVAFKTALNLLKNS